LDGVSSGQPRKRENFSLTIPCPGVMWWRSAELRQTKLNRPLSLSVRRQRFACPATHITFVKGGMQVKLLLIGSLVVLIIGIGLNVLHFSLAKFFAANARALDRNQNVAEQMATEPQKTEPLRITEAVPPEKGEYKTAKAGS
jgi:site-specific recombinase